MHFTQVSVQAYLSIQMYVVSRKMRETEMIVDNVPRLGPYALYGLKPATL